jgi:hypothetical protein
MMKRITVLLLTISIILCLASGSSRAQQSPANSLRVPTEKNTLIVCLSRTNNTKAIAEFIQSSVSSLNDSLALWLSSDENRADGSQIHRRGGIHSENSWRSGGN